MDFDLLNRMFSHGNVALFVWKNEADWPVQWTSPSVTALLGYTPEEWMAGEVLFADLVHPEDLPRVGGEVADAVETGVADFVHEDYRLRCKDGEWVWVSDSTVIDRGPGGEALRFIGYLVDVTSRHHVEDELRKNRDRLQLVVEGARLGIWDWNPQTGDVVFDQHWAAMLGYDVEELEPHVDEWSGRVHPDDLESCFADIQDHIDGKIPFFENVHRLRHRDGHWVWILDRGRIVDRDIDGKPTRFMGTHIDISKQKVAEQEARAASDAKTAFLARMSHEIRTPLNGVLGMVQLLQETELDEEQQRYVELLADSGDALLSIVGDVLDVSKIEAGQMSLEDADFEVERVLNSVFDLYEERAVAKGIRYEREIAPDTPVALRGDSHRIRQIVGNLLSNAIKFTHVGEVQLRVRAIDLEDGRVQLVIRVRDTGTGIENTDLIWEEFTQEDSSISRRHGGTGLGLAICRQLVELMGGSIDVDSMVGIGSTFTVRVPLARVESRPSTGPSTTEFATRPRLKVLVAEDNHTNQTILAGMLGRLGQDVTLVSNGLQAVEACTDAPFDLVFMDVHMPLMSGLSATREIISKLNPAPRIIALSAEIFFVDTESLTEVGFSGLANRPVKLSELASFIDEAAKLKAESSSDGTERATPLVCP